MALGQTPSLGDRLVQPVTNISDFIWAGLWNGEAVIPFPPLAIILLGVGLWFMAGLRFYPITKLGAAAKGLFAGLGSLTSVALNYCSGLTVLPKHWMDANLWNGVLDFK